MNTKWSHVKLRTTRKASNGSSMCKWNFWKSIKEDPRRLLRFKLMSLKQSRQTIGCKC